MILIAAGRYQRLGFLKMCPTSIAFWLQSGGRLLQSEHGLKDPAEIQCFAVERGGDDTRQSFIKGERV